MRRIARCTVPVHVALSAPASRHGPTPPLASLASYPPRQWEVRALKGIEAAMRPQVDRCRRNRLRDPLSDVSTHIQYEAWLRAAYRRNPDVEARIVVEELHGGDAVSYPYVGVQHKEYAFFIFEDDAPSFYSKLDDAMLGYEGGPPIFFGIDDDLTVWTPEVIAFHATRLAAFFERHWATRAPWETDGGASPPHAP